MKEVDLSPMNNPLQLHVTFHVNQRTIDYIHLGKAPAFGYSVEGESSALNPMIEAWIYAYTHGHNLPRVPLRLEHFSPFQRAVFQQMQKIPVGQVMSYQALAAAAGHPKAARAVGTVCRRNPYPLIVPCHRVVCQNGKLGGFAFGLILKQQLLAFEEKTASASKGEKAAWVSSSAFSTSAI